ncbi:MAG: condensation domain-containing protein, partial [Acidobacteriota bacterium]
EREGQPVQRFVPPGEFTLAVEDLGAAPDADAEARRIAAAEQARAFDLESDALYRVRLLRLAPRRHVLLVTQHHIISDGWSIGVLVREVGALYTAFSRGEPSPLEPLPVQYVDVAAWQRGAAGAAAFAAQTEYWRRRLAGAPACVELPADRPRPKVRTGRGGRVRLDFPPDLGRAVAALGRELGATSFMVLETAFAGLLARSAGLRGGDILVGTPTANRGRPETEGLIGLFVNTLVLRHTFDAPSMTFRDAVGQVRTTVLEAFENADLPFEEVVRAVEAPRDTRHSPLFQVMFTFNAESGGELDLPDLEVRALGGAESGGDTGQFDTATFDTAKFDLTLVMGETAEGLVGDLEFSRDLFDAATAAAFGRRFVTWLGHLVEQPDRPLAECPVMDAAERRQVLGAFGDTSRDHSTLPLIPRQILDRAAAEPDAP